MIRQHTGTNSRGPVDQAARFVLATGHLFGLRALEGIIASDAWVQGRLSCSAVVRLPHERASATVGYADIGTLGQGIGAQVLTAGQGSLIDLKNELERIAPTYLLVIGWSRLVAGSVLDIPARTAGPGSSIRNTPRFGCIGMHPSPLPVGRGQAPIPWSIIHGLRRTALTTFFLEDTADSGAIVAQRFLDIRPRETATSLFVRIADEHFVAGRDLGTAMADRNVESAPQEESRTTIWPRRRPRDSHLDFSLPAEVVERTIRAVQWPYPLPTVTYRGRELQVLQGTVVSTQFRGAPGEIRVAGRTEFDVTCNPGLLRLHTSTDIESRLVPPPGEQPIVEDLAMRRP